jgi:hypothetical protein
MPANAEDLIKDIFADLSSDRQRKAYKSEDPDAEAAKIARLRHLRLARDAGLAAKRPRRLIATR